MSRQQPRHQVLGYANFLGRKAFPLGGAVCIRERRSVPRCCGFAGRQRASRPVASGQPHTYGVRQRWPRRMAYSMPARTRSLHLCSWQRNHFRSPSSRSRLGPLLPSSPKVLPESKILPYVPCVPLCTLMYPYVLKYLRSRALERSCGQRSVGSCVGRLLSLAMELSPQSALAELRRRNRAQNRRKRAIAAALADGKVAPLKRDRMSRREQEAALAAIATLCPKMQTTITTIFG